MSGFPERRVVMTDVAKQVGILSNFERDTDVPPGAHLPDGVCALDPFDPQTGMSAIGRQLP